MAQSLPATGDVPEVAALRKKVRGETLSEDERALLASATRKPSGTGISHAAIETELEERKRRGV